MYLVVRFDNKCRELKQAVKSSGWNVVRDVVLVQTLTQFNSTLSFSSFVVN